MSEQIVDKKIKSCDYIEMASCYALDGIRTCVHGTINGPLLATTQELVNGTVSYKQIVDRRAKILEEINSPQSSEKLPCTKCAHLKEKNVSEVDISFLGGKRLPAGMNIQHFSACNQRCTYCAFTTQDLWLKSHTIQLNTLRFSAKKENYEATIG